MAAKISNNPENQSSPRPQFNVGGQVSVLRNSHPRISSPSNSELTQCFSWATTGISPESDSQFHSEINNRQHLDKSSSIQSHPEMSHSRSLNPELLMREFMHDEEQSDIDSPTAGFKSSFAREVMQNVRKNERQQAPARRYLAINTQDQIEENYNSVRNASFYNSGKEKVSAMKGGRLSMPALGTSRRPQNFSSNKFRSQFAVRSHLLLDEDSDEREDHSGPRDDQWMSSTQFKAMLDNQEELDDDPLDNESDLLDNENNSGCSYLDQEAKIPFRKLKQTCDDLGFTFSEQEWSELRRLLFIDPNQRSGDDLMVRNGDFFAAVHLIMSNKHSRLRRDETLKYSMKSDSGGEMESCRSSDSELERELHEKEREIQQLQRELSSSYRSLAERDTELFRVRLECQRLTEDNRSLREQTSRFKLYGPQTKRQLEMEQEIDQLRWKLVAMEDSRRTYESATERLVMFLEQVTTMLQATSPSQRKFLESTRAEVSKIAKRTRMQNHKRFSLDSSSIFRAESMPGLNSSVTSSSGVGMSTGNFHGSLLSLSTTMSGGDAATTSSSVSSNSHRSTSAIPRRTLSSTSSSAIVQRSQSTQSKRSGSNLPSVRERQEKSESIYVNSDIIREFIAEEAQDEPAELLPRPQSAAAILHGKRHVCEIKIGGNNSEEIQVKEKKRGSLSVSPAKRSNSVLSSGSSANSRIQVPNQKASKILGLDPQQQLVIQNFSADSGRFSISSRTSSASAHSSPVLPPKKMLDKRSTAKEIEDEIQVAEEHFLKPRNIEKDNSASELLTKNRTVEMIPIPEPQAVEQKLFEPKIVERKIVEQTRVESVIVEKPHKKLFDSKVNEKLRSKSVDKMFSEKSVDQIDKNKKEVQLLVSKESRSASNPPPKESRLREEDRAKFKSLGDLHIEKGLPSVPPPIDGDVDEDKKQLVIKAAHTLMKGVRSMMSRDKTLTITPKKASSKSLSSVSLTRGQKPTLQLLSHSSFPGLPTYPVLAASHSSPWNC